MTTSVAIAVYNGAMTLQATLESVFGQTQSPDEILVVDDGSTDATSSILRLYGSRITVITQENKGLSASRNVLCKHASGELIAFLDADDVWHPEYLERQYRVFRTHPRAAAFFTGHVNFTASEDLTWDESSVRDALPAEVIEPADFVSRYAKATGPFASPSYCCVPKSVLQAIGDSPFDERVRVCEDAYLFYLLALEGRIVYTPATLAAYRLSPGSLSSNRLRNLYSGVHVCELLEDRYRKEAPSGLLGAFRRTFAAKRREYAKVLIGTGQVTEAQRQLLLSIKQVGSPESISKGLALLVLSHAPRVLQPEWPSPTIR